MSATQTRAPRPVIVIEPPQKLTRSEKKARRRELLAEASGQPQPRKPQDWPPLVTIAVLAVVGFGGAIACIAYLIALLVGWAT